MAGSPPSRRVIIRSAKPAVVAVVDEEAQSAAEEEERKRRLMVEVHRLAGLATIDWQFQIISRAKFFAEHYGVSSAQMKALILACLQDMEKAKTEERRIEQRAERRKEKVKREEERKAETMSEKEGAIWL